MSQPNLGQWVRDRARMAPFEPAALRFLLGAPLILIASTVHAEVGGAETLRSRVQAEKDAGRVFRFHVAEHYGAIGVTAAPSATRKNLEAEAEFAREWAETFCAAASRDFQWNRRWRLIVYVYGQSNRAYSCTIPKAAQNLERRSYRRTSEDRSACDDRGLLLESEDEVE